MAKFAALRAEKANTLTSVAEPISATPTPALDLANWWESPTRARVQAKQPRRWLGQTKLSLPVLGLLLLLLAFLWPAFMPALPDVKATLDKLRPGVVEELAMFDLNYRGTNQQGQPFAVEAAKAVRTGASAEAPTVALTAPSADLTTASGSFVALSANNGLYDEKNQALHMQGDVEIIHDNGTVLNAPLLEVDFSSNSARTNKPVSVHGRFGEIHAPGMQLQDGGDRIIFNGTPGTPARATINSAPEGGLSSAGMTFGADPAIAAPLLASTPVAAPVVPPVVPPTIP